MKAFLILDKRDFHIAFEEGDIEKLNKIDTTIKCPLYLSKDNEIHYIDRTDLFFSSLTDHDLMTKDKNIRNQFRNLVHYADVKILIEILDSKNSLFSYQISPSLHTLNYIFDSLNKDGSPLVIKYAKDSFLKFYFLEKYRDVFLAKERHFKIKNE